MKIIKNVLAGALSQLAGIARGSHQSASYVLIGCTGGRCSLTADNLSTRLTIAFDQEGEISALLPLRKLAEILSRSECEFIEIKIESEWALINAGKSSFKVATLPTEGFPQRARLGELSVCQTSGLQHLIYESAYAASRDIGRSALCGSCLSLKNNELTLVSTDGRRLAVSSMHQESGDEFEATVPTECLNHLQSLAMDEIQISCETNFIHFAGPGWSLSSRLIEGTFPNWKHVVPSEWHAVAVVNREELISSIQRAAIATTDTHNSCKVTFSRDGIEARCESETGNAQDSLACSWVNASPKSIVISLNPDYVIQALQSLACDEVRISLIDPLSPVMIANPETGAFAIIMVMRIS